MEHWLTIPEGRKPTPTYRICLTLALLALAAIWVTDHRGIAGVVSDCSAPPTRIVAHLP